MATVSDDRHMPKRRHVRTPRTRHVDAVLARVMAAGRPGVLLSIHAIAGRSPMDDLDLDARQVNRAGRALDGAIKDGRRVRYTSGAFLLDRMPAQERTRAITDVASGGCSGLGPDACLA